MARVANFSFLTDSASDACSATYPFYEKITFDFVASNPVYAATAGAVAAFCLAVVVIGLGQTDDRQRGFSVDRTSGIGLFLVAFFCLLMTTLLYAEASGYTACGLLVEASIVPSMPFAVGSTAAFAALIWAVEGRGELLERTAQGLLSALTFVASLSLFAGNATIFALHFGKQNSLTVLASGLLILLAWLLFWALQYRTGAVPALGASWLTITASGITVASVLWQTALTLGWLGYTGDDLATGFKDGVGFEILGRSIAWAAFIVIVRLSVPGRAPRPVLSEASVPPDMVLDGEDPWDLDSVTWLLAQPGGDFWEKDDLLECLRHDPRRLEQQPGLVSRAEVFASVNGVRLEVEPLDEGEVYRLYRTDTDAPAYPRSPGERRSLLSASVAAATTGE